MTSAKEFITVFHEQLRRHFILHWLLSNIFGWSIGLFVGSVMAGIVFKVFGNLIGVLIGLPLAGAVVGAVVGAAQSNSLTGLSTQFDDERRWVTFSALGGAVGALPVFLTMFVLVIGKLGLVVIGGVFGLCFGWMQSSALNNNSGRPVIIWVVANMIGSGLCSFFSINGLPFALPVFCSLGPVLFGLITGFAVLTLIRNSEI
jgi:hypothetical protein